ncbi:MAG: class I SAM-dependent methyltransferase [Candidatus Omnitrophota bacterium]|jgi:extracellular factor (EF) 3-hydroxypalmitic acid methyl ester biosynthesis protein
MKEQGLNRDLTKLTQELKSSLESVKNEFGTFDKNNPDKDVQIAFLESRKKEISEQLDSCLSKVWETVKHFDKPTYKLHQEYCQRIMSPLIEEGIEINKHLYEKPFGYPGDYVMMNYIYNYHDKNYLGDTSYQRLLNNYACNISISKSNIIRKNFIKRKILETVKTADKTRISSIGSGPARELIELLKEGKIKKNIEFVCLDFEKKALDYVRSEIDTIDEKYRKNLHVSYIHKDIIDFIADILENKERDKHFDLIYVAGVFDYLSNRICSKLTKKLYGLLNKNALLIICNISSKNLKHRAYYEFLGNWVMIHKSQEEMLAWTHDLNDVEEIKFEQPIEGANYLFLSIKRI